MMSRGAIMDTIDIEIPDELLERMNQFKGVNWNRVAVKAFEKAIEDHDKKL